MIYVNTTAKNSPQRTKPITSNHLDSERYQIPFNHCLNRGISGLTIAVSGCQNLELSISSFLQSVAPQLLYGNRLIFDVTLIYAQQRQRELVATCNHRNYSYSRQ